jgi:hypothetical protein
VAALAHVGVGLVGKRFAPAVPLPVLLLGAWAVDIAWAGFWLAGLDHFPAVGLEVPAPWSHSLLMAVVLSALTALVTARLSRSTVTRVLVPGLVFSHWLVDFVTQPMGAAFPGAGFRMRLLFSESPTVVGLGLYDSAAAMYVVDYGLLLTGVVVYVLTVRGGRTVASSAQKHGPLP